MARICEVVARFCKGESGASAAGYVLILAIVTTGITLATVSLGDIINVAACNSSLSPGC